MDTLLTDSKSEVHLNFRNSINSLARYFARDDIASEDAYLIFGDSLVSSFLHIPVTCVIAP